MSEELYGTRAIREAKLEAFDNRTPDRDYTIQFTIPEFTCLCPISGFPDFATLHIRYVPGPRCVELKSLKLYINGYRNQNVYHEDVVNVVLGDLVTLLEPRYCEVVGDFNVRGNIKTVVRAKHRESIVERRRRRLVADARKRSTGRVLEAARLRRAEAGVVTSVTRAAAKLVRSLGRASRLSRSLGRGQIRCVPGGRRHHPCRSMQRSE